MPEPADFYSVLRSLFAAAAIALAAYGFGRPLERLFRRAAADRFDTGVRSLLLGFPAAGFALAALGTVGCLGPISISLVTLAGTVLACVELACSAAGCSGFRATLASFTRPPTQRRNIGGIGLACLAGVVLTAQWINALAPPIDQATIAQTLDAPKLVLLAGTFWCGEGGRLALLSLPQIWTMWGLALDGPVAASLVDWQLAVVTALAAVVVARNWLPKNSSWLAGSLVVLSPTCWGAGAFGCGAAGNLAGILVLLAAVDLHIRGRDATSQLNYALAALIFSLPAVDATFVPASSLARNPLLLIALSGLVIGTPRQRVVLAAASAVLLGSWCWPNATRLFAVAFPGLAVAGALGAVALVRLQRPAAVALVGVVVCLATILTGDAARMAWPKAAVALGWQSREDYLLAASGTYRAATVFNQIRLPEQRLFSTATGCFYFASAITAPAELAKCGPNDPAELVAEAVRQGCEYLLLAEPLGEPPGGSLAPAARRAAPASSLVTAIQEPAAAEKFASAVEVIPIVEYEFADEYQRTTRYRLWKLQGLPAAASPAFESADRGEEASSRPRPLTR